MSFMQLLQPDEGVIARVGPFYATSRRVLRYDSPENGKEQLTELPYNRVRSIELVRPPNHRLMAGGVVMTASGLFLTLTWGLFTPMLAIPGGIAMIVVGGNGTGRGTYFQLHSEGATKKDLALWRIPYHDSAAFIAAVGDRTDRRR